LVTASPGGDRVEAVERLHEREDVGPGSGDSSWPVVSFGVVPAVPWAPGRIRWWSGRHRSREPRCGPASHACDVAGVGTVAFAVWLRTRATASPSTSTPSLKADLPGASRPCPAKAPPAPKTKGWPRRPRRSQGRPEDAGGGGRGSAPGVGSPIGVLCALICAPPVTTTVRSLNERVAD